MDFPNLESKRLRFIEITDEHAAEMFEIFSKDEVTQYYGMDSFQFIEEAENLIHAYHRRFQENTAIRWGIIHKASNRFIGSIGLNGLHLIHKRAEIGYELHPNFWRKGYMSEAIQTVLTYSFHALHLNRVGAVVFPENLPSQALLEKNGLNKEGLLRGYIYQGGQARDTYVYSILNEEFNEI